MAKKLEMTPTLILVGDNEENRAEMKQMLELSGYDVMTNANQG